MTTELVAPTRIAPGESVQLILNARWSDGTTTDVTAQATWQTSNARTLTVTSSGLLTGVANGEATVLGRYSNMSRNRSLLVLPTGTFRLRGQVKEADVGVSGVSISVESAGMKQTASSSFGGVYAFYGVAGRTAIEARMEGYLPKFEQVDVVEDRTYDIQLAPARTRADVSGRWRLTVSASACQTTRYGPLTEEAMTRRYTATITQNGPRLTMALSDADFVIVSGRGNTISGTTDPNDFMRLTIAGPSDYYYAYYRISDLVERLSDGTQLLISGSVAASGNSQRIAGTLEGSFVLKLDSGTRTAECWAQNHRFEMGRQ